MESYETYSSWKTFQTFFPEEWRITSKYKPIEYYWNWDNFDVHIDHYYVDSTQKKHKLILLHGGGGNGRLLSPIAVFLQKLGYECIAPDLPGFGLTKIHKSNSYYTWINLVNELVNQELEKSKTPIVLCGVSLGGMLAYQVACLNKKISGLIVTSLADTRKKSVQIGLSKNKWFGAISPTLLSGMSGITDDIKIPIKWTTKMWAMANNPEFVKALKNDKIGSGSAVCLKFFRTLFEVSPKMEPEDFNMCPLLFLQPEKDYIIPWSMSKPFYESLSCKKEMVILKNCGHIPLEKPGINQMIDAATSFLDKL